MAKVPMTYCRFCYRGSSKIPVGTQLATHDDASNEHHRIELGIERFWFPAILLHYVADHGYSPPEDFVQVVMRHTPAELARAWTPMPPGRHLHCHRVGYAPEVDHRFGAPHQIHGFARVAFLTNLTAVARVCRRLTATAPKP